MSDSDIRKVREYRGKVRNLRMFRARGYCEICRQPFGMYSLALKGHHIIQPTKCQGKDPNSDDNIIICCDSCYNSKLLMGEKIERWIPPASPKKPATIFNVIKSRAKPYIVKTERVITKAHKLHWIGFKFIYKYHLIVIGISWVNKNIVL